MRVDRYRAIEVFCQVVALDSFTLAAAALHMPKGRVTTVVQELEAYLDVRLLMRTTRRISLTEDGALYHQRATAMLHKMGELEGMLRRAAVATVLSRLRVDVPAAVGCHMVGPALPEFFSRYPDIVLELGSTDRPVYLVAEGVDCVIRGGLVQTTSWWPAPWSALRW